MKLFKDLTLFEQRILCHKLPKSFDSIKTDSIQEQCQNKRNKIIQELKRRMLNVDLEQYEIKIQSYEHLFQENLTTLQLQILNPTSDSHKCQVDIVMHFVKQYFTHHTNTCIHQIRYQESCLHAKFLRHYRRHSSATNKTIDVYPQIIVDVSKVSLNHKQLEYLSRCGKLEILLFNSDLIY